MASLTTHLINLDSRALQESTTHPFLSAAAQASLPLSKLKSWLGQDRLYQMAYLNFIGSMLSIISIPTKTTQREDTVQWRAADLLIDCIANIREEIRMFEQTAQAEGWLEEICNVEVEVQTRCYQDLFAGATARGRPLTVGLCVLWATEWCYLRSWRFAREEMVREGGEEAVGKGDAMQRVFIPNWSSEEFEKFVDRIGSVVDEFGRACDEGSEEWKECEIVWRQVLWAEREFWPKL